MAPESPPRSEASRRSRGAPRVLRAAALTGAGRAPTIGANGTRPMIPRLLPRLRADQAARILSRVFAPVREPFAFRLWDGTVVPLGDGAPAFTVVLRSPETFARVLRDPSPRTFAEAYVEDALDIEGDLFAAMTVANVVEALGLSRAARLRLLLSLWRRAS